MAADEAQPTEAESQTMALTGVLSEEQFAKLHELRSDAAPQLRGETIDLAGTRAYLSLPDDATAPLPGVLVIHEWWGLNDHIRHWADRLAADGYAALAVDLYGGEVATEPDAAMQLMKAVDPKRAEGILSAGHAFLAEDPRVAAQRRGVVGWCFGGGWSLQTAIVADDLDAAVVYYGRLVTDPEQLAEIDAPVLGVFGNRDEGIPPSSVDAFEAAMKQADKSLELHRYDADHAFANPSSARYEPEAAEDAFGHVRRFFDQHLRDGSDTASPS